MIHLIENTKAYKKLEGFKQTLLLKRSNRQRIEEEVVTARNAGVANWQPPQDFPAHWQAIVREVAAQNLKP